MSVSGTFVRKWLTISGFLLLFRACVLHIIFGNPAQWACYESAVTGHIEDTINGVLLLAMAAVTNHMVLSDFSWILFHIFAQLGAWLNGTPFWIMAFTGQGPADIAQFTRKYAIVDGPWAKTVWPCLLTCGFCIMLAFLMGAYGAYNCNSKSKTT